MQTFLPYEDFTMTAQCLDDKRLGKQRVEAKQILLALGVDVGQHRGNPASSWRNHPATKMWRGYEAMLCSYASKICQEWIARGFNDSLLVQFVDCYFSVRGEKVKKPEWLGRRDLHASHRSNLLRKDAEHYGQFDWSEKNDLPYVWPT